MAIQLQCHRCGSVYNVDDSLAGTQAPCTQCATVLTVPMPTYGGQLAGKPAMQPAAGYYQQEPKKLGNGLLLWGLVGGGAFSLIAIVLALILFLPSSTDTQVASDQPANERTNQTTQAPRQVPTPKRPTNPVPTTPSPTPRPPRTYPGFQPAQPANSDNPSPFENDKPDPDSEDGSEPIVASKTPNVPVRNSVGSPTAWASDSVQIPFKDESEITLGPLGCPIVISGQDVWHLEKKQIVQQIKGEYNKRGIKVLSANGQWFAAAAKSPNQKETPIVVWNTVTGEQASEIPGHAEKFADFIRFSRDQYLLVGGRHSSEIDVWDVQTGKQMSSIVTPARRVEQETIEFSPDGEFFTSIFDDRLCVIRTKTRKTAAVMENPPPIIEPDTKPNSVQMMIYTQRVIADIETVRFSPDGQQLAAITGRRNGRRLICWNNKGKLIFDKMIPRIQHFFHEPKLYWLADGSGWSISGHIYDKETQHVVFAPRFNDRDEPMYYPVGKTHMLGVFAARPNTLELVEIPWDKINASLKLLEGKAPAILTPAQPVSIKLALKGARGDERSTGNMLTKTLSTRLAHDGIRVQSGSSTWFGLRLSEKAGDTLPIFERQSAFDRRGRDTGRTATEAKGALVIELFAGDEVIWRDSVTAESSSSFSEEITDESIRKSMLERITKEMNRISLPYFVPSSKDHIALPVVIE
jgi:WD40 repeat protein